MIDGRIVIVSNRGHDVFISYLSPTFIFLSFVKLDCLSFGRQFGNFSRSFLWNGFISDGLRWISTLRKFRMSYIIQYIWLGNIRVSLNFWSGIVCTVMCDIGFGSFDNFVTFLRFFFFLGPIFILIWLVMMVVVVMMVLLVMMVVMLMLMLFVCTGGFGWCRIGLLLVQACLVHTGLHFVKSIMDSLFVFSLDRFRFAIEITWVNVDIVSRIMYDRFGCQSAFDQILS